MNERLPQGAVDTSPKSDGVSRRLFLKTIALGVGSAAINQIQAAEAASTSAPSYLSIPPANPRPASVPKNSTEALRERSMQILDIADKRIRKLYCGLGPMSPQSKVDEKQRIIQQIYTELDTYPLDPSLYIQKEIDLVRLRGETSSQYENLAAISFLEETNRSKHQLKRKGNVFVVEHNGQEWEFVPLGRNEHKYNDAITVSRFDTKTQTTKMGIVPLLHVMAAAYKGDYSDIIGVAESQWQSEQEGKARLKNFDIPGHLHVLHVAPASFDEVTSPGLLQTYILARALRGARPNRKVDLTLQFIRKPEADIRRAMNRVKLTSLLQLKKPPTLMLDINAHGNEGCTKLEESVEPKTIAKLVGQYGEAFVKTMSCNTGGLGWAGGEKPDTLFADTQPQTVNLLPVRSATYGQPPYMAVRGSVYTNFLIQSLLKNPSMPFGHHAAYSDEQCKKEFRVNPMAKVHGFYTE